MWLFQDSDFGMESEADRILPSTAPESHSGPWLVYLNGDEERTQTFYSLSEARCYRRSITMIQRNIICATRQGWLLTINFQDRHCSLWNPCTLVEIDLPFPPKGIPARIYSQCVLSHSPTDPHCMVVYVNYVIGRIFFCHPTSKNWTIYDFDLQSYGGDAIFFNGKFYMVSYPRVAVMDFAPTPRLSFVINERKKIEGVDFRFHRRAEVLESRGEMFSICTYYFQSNGKPVDFLVCKMDFSKKEWVTVESIGSDQVFLHGTGNPFESRTSWSASALGVKGDCIYYIADDAVVYIFDLEKETISSLRACSDVENTVSLPFWLVPSVWTFYNYGTKILKLIYDMIYSLLFM